jgi:hypothetical protein
MSEATHDQHEKVWRALIRQAWQDITEDGGLGYKGDETQNVKMGRQLEAYHWLFTERSDEAFYALRVYGDGFREKLRQKLQRQGFVLPQGAVKKLSSDIPHAEDTEKFELEEAA